MANSPCSAAARRVPCVSAPCPSPASARWYAAHGPTTPRPWVSMKAPSRPTGACHCSNAASPSPPTSCATRRLPRWSVTAPAAARCTDSGARLLGNTDTVAARALGCIQGRVGALQHLLRSTAVEIGDADTDRHRNRTGLGRGRGLLQAPAHPLGKLKRVVDRCIRQQRNELLATEPPGLVVASQVLTDDVGHALQHRIADGMTPGVIHLLEVVDVEHQQRTVTDRPLVSLMKRAIEPDEETATIRQTGQGIGRGQRLELALALLALGDVAHQPDSAKAFAIIDDRHPVDLQ